MRDNLPLQILTFFLATLTGVNTVSIAHAEEGRRHVDFIQVTGTGKVAKAPDKADLTLSVEIQAKSAESARAQAATAMAALIKAVKKENVADKDIQTRYVSLYPVYAPDTANRVSGYQLANQVAVVVRDLDRVSNIIDAAVGAGGNAVRVQGIGFAIDKPESALAEARELAFGEARTKAEQYAKLGDVKLGRVMQISESGGMAPIPVPYAEMSAMPMAKVADSTPVQIGEQEVSVTVNVVFGIE